MVGYPSDSFLLKVCNKQLTY